MMNTPLSSTGQLARYLVAGPLLLGLALGWSAARAQDGGPAPTATPVSAAARHTNALFFLDGQPSDEATVYQLKGRFVADVDVIDGEHLRRMFGAVPEKAAVVVTTKGHTGLPAVLALNDRIARSAPKAAPADQLPAIQVAKHGEQNAPTAVPAPPRPAAPQQSRPVVYYLDGQRQANPDFATSIVPATIASIDMIKDERAQELLGADAGQNVVIATTKANQHRADVEAFNKRIGVGVPPTAPVAAPTPRVAYLAAPALAYITTHYPNARLLSVAEAPAATDGAGPRYQAEIVVGRRPAYLLFDAQGRFLAESFTSSAR